MGIANYINQLDKRYAWSLLGFILAVLFGALSIYTEFIRDKHPQLKFEIISDASVLDVHENLGNLEILYDGIDIKKAKKSLRVIVFRVTNEGPDDILKVHFDDKKPFGFKVLNGSLVRAEIISSSSSYLKESLTVLQQGQNSAVFEPVIFEANESFTVKSLILYPDEIRPVLETIGKIAGVRKLEVVDSSTFAADPNFFTQTFSGTVWIQTTRLVTYFFGFIVVVALVVAPLITITELLSKRRRIKHIAQFKKITKTTLNELDEYLFQSYIKHDILYLRNLQRAMLNEGRVISAIHRYDKRMQQQRNRDEVDFMMTPTMIEGGRHALIPSIHIQEIIKIGLIVKDGTRWLVDSHAKDTLEELLRFLEIIQPE